ncbi:MAG: hypothetical protein ROR55_20175 [Devosia sp.]
MTSDMGEMFNELKRARKERRAERRAAFSPGPEWFRHHETHYSRDLLGDRLDYGRIIADVLVDGQDVGRALVRAGVVREWKGKREAWC